MRTDVVACLVALDRHGLNVGTAGNVSARCGNGVLVSPSGLPVEHIGADDIVLLDLDGRIVTGHRAPTSEWRLHIEVLRARPEVGAIVHAHSPECTAVAVHGRALPAVHYVIARAGGTVVPCAPYATYGTPELAAHVVATLGEAYHACLLANHGMIALGSSLTAALGLARDLEWAAGVYRRAQAYGDPTILSDANMERVAEQFRRYGQPPAD